MVEAWGRKVVAINLTINTENKSAKSLEAGWTLDKMFQNVDFFVGIANFFNNLYTPEIRGQTVDDESLFELDGSLKNASFLHKTVFRNHRLEKAARQES
jgi:hypothetical protein